MNNTRCDIPVNQDFFSPSPPGTDNPLPPEVERIAAMHPNLVPWVGWLRHLWVHANLEPSGPVRRRRGGIDWCSTVYIDLGTETTTLIRDPDSSNLAPAESLIYESFGIVEMRFFTPESLRPLVFANLQADSLLVVRIPSTCWTNNYCTRIEVLRALAHEIIAASHGFGGLSNHLLTLMAPNIRSSLVASFIACFRTLTVCSVDLGTRHNRSRVASRQLRYFHGMQQALVLTQLDSNTLDGCIGVALFAPNDLTSHTDRPSVTFLIRIRNAQYHIFSDDFLMDTLRRYFRISDEASSLNFIDFPMD